MNSEWSDKSVHPHILLSASLFPVIVHLIFQEVKKQVEKVMNAASDLGLHFLLLI